MQNTGYHGTIIRITTVSTTMLTIIVITTRTAKVTETVRAIVAAFATIEIANVNGTTATVCFLPVQRLILRVVTCMCMAPLCSA